MADADHTAGSALGKGVPAKSGTRKQVKAAPPQADWDEAMDGAHRPAKAEAKHGQGKLTRQATKDIISRRS